MMMIRVDLKEICLHKWLIEFMFLQLVVYTLSLDVHLIKDSTGKYFGTRNSRDFVFI